MHRALVLPFSASLAVVASTGAVASAAPVSSVGYAFTAAAFNSSPLDAPGTFGGPGPRNRTLVSNLLVYAASVLGRLRVSITAGTYDFPTVGQAIEQAAQPGANASLFSAVPLAEVRYAVGAHLGVAAGKLASLLGQESPFTYQNLNIERGLAWAMEPTISRGVRATYANKRFEAALEADDGYYSGHDRAVEWLVGYQTSSNARLQFAGILPGGGAAPNPTAAVANKAEYDLMYTREIGKLRLEPYLLLANSPASARLGYARDERARAVVLLGSYAFSRTLSLAVRYEDAENDSSPSDTGRNADLVGYGPGSSARSFTITPTVRIRRDVLLRLEYSRVSVSSLARGLGFGLRGTGTAQSRFGIEFGVVR
ncbi:MAG: outer membrane beta-barrel protein [Vulcanimicrobiaceae bacterium]